MYFFLSKQNGFISRVFISTRKTFSRKIPVLVRLKSVLLCHKEVALQTLSGSQFIMLWQLQDLWWNFHIPKSENQYTNRGASSCPQAVPVV